MNSFAADKNLLEISKSLSVRVIFFFFYTVYHKQSRATEIRANVTLTKKIVKVFLLSSSPQKVVGPVWRFLHAPHQEMSSLYLYQLRLRNGSQLKLILKPIRPTGSSGFTDFVSVGLEIHSRKMLKCCVFFCTHSMNRNGVRGVQWWKMWYKQTKDRI